MSNAKKPAAKSTSLARYRAEVKGDPFVLWLDDENTITIPRPTGDQMFDAEEAFRVGTSRDVVRVLAGDQADALFNALGAEDMAVMRAVVGDIQEHFGLGE